FTRIDRTQIAPLNPSLNPTGSEDVSDDEIENNVFNMRFIHLFKESFLSNWDNSFYRDEFTMIKTRRNTSRRKDTRKVKTTGIKSSLLIGDVTKENWELLVGGEFFQDNNNGIRDGQELENFPDGTGKYQGHFVQLLWNPLEKIDVMPGLRWDKASFESDNPSHVNKEYSQWSKSLTLKYHPSINWELFASYGEGFNAPRLQDLYIDGFHHSGTFFFPDNYFTPNPDLRPESSNGFEVGFKSNFTGKNLLWNYFLEGTYFRTDVSDYIAEEIDLLAGTTRFINLQNVLIKGYEFQAGVDYTWLGVSLSYSSTRGYNKNDGHNLSDMPMDTWRLSNYFNFFDNQLTLGHKITVAEGQDRFDENEYEDNSIFHTPGHIVHDSFVKWASMGKLDGLTTVFRLENVFDKSYRRHTNNFNEPGRNFIISAKYNW
ncbi:MAG: TonB-dependent receptor domain-containing protein, partial [Bacteriovoracia bacterium]